MNSNDDRRAFAEAMRNVKPLQRTDRAATTGRRPAARVRLGRTLTPNAAETKTEAGGARAQSDPIAFRRPGLSMHGFRQLRRGRLRIEAEIDLHGLTGSQAQTALGDFIVEAVDRSLSCVRVVHGKGKRSGPGGPVLKNLVHRWLSETDHVLAFVTAGARHGGSGAVLALLKHR